RSRRCRGRAARTRGARRSRRSPRRRAARARPGGGRDRARMPVPLPCRHGSSARAAAPLHAAARDSPRKNVSDRRRGARYRWRMTPDEFRRLGHQLIDWVAESRATLAARPVQSPVRPGEVSALLPASPPVDGGALDGLIAELDRVVMPGITHWNHPAFFAYFPANTSLASVLADLVCAGL